MPKQNVNQAEVKKFGALASSWWDPEGELKSLHDINPLRLDWIRTEANDLNNKKVLDVGCGGGLLSESMATEGAAVTGIDLAEDSLQIARLHGLESGIEIDYQCVSAESHATSNAGEYDLVTCMELLEHVPDPASIVTACAKLVKPGGMVFFSTLNRNPKSFALGIIAAEYILRMVPKGTHEYGSFITPSELAKMARLAGLNIRSMAGISYHALSRTYSVSNNTDINYMMAAIKE